MLIKAYNPDRVARGRRGNFRGRPRGQRSQSWRGSRAGSSQGHQGQKRAYDQSSQSSGSNSGYAFGGPPKVNFNFSQANASSLGQRNDHFAAIGSPRKIPRTWGDQPLQDQNNLPPRNITMGPPPPIGSHQGTASQALNSISAMFSGNSNWA